MKAAEHLQGKTGPLWTLLILALIALLAVVELVTPPEISFSLFFLIPVAMATWLLGRFDGILISLLSAVIILATHLIQSRIYPDQFVHYWNAFKELATLLVVTFVLAALKDALHREQNLSRTDYLTEIANGRYFYEMAAAEAARAQRFAHPVTVIYMDIDNFKPINDRLGHAMGDALLRATASAIRECIRNVDTVARLGGDEFGVLLPGASFEEAGGVIERIRDNLTAVLRRNGWDVTFSIGAVTCSGLCPSEEMVRAADELMYAVKSEGKNNLRHERRG